MDTINRTPAETIVKLLTNLSDTNVIRELVAKDAIYVSLNYDNPELKKIMPWCGTNKGVDAYVDNLAMIYQCWETLAFDPGEIFGSDERVALFGSFKYRSRVLGQTVSSPFSIFAKVKDGKVIYLNLWRTLSRPLHPFKLAHCQELTKTSRILNHLPSRRD